MNTTTFTFRALLAPLAAAFALTAGACDQPDSDVSTFVFEAEELAEMAADAGNDELAASLRAEDGVDAASLDLSGNTTSKYLASLEQCLAEYCFDLNGYGQGYAGQCINAEHPFGMPGVCILVDPPPHCLMFEFHGEFCSNIASTTQTD